jgi:protein TonB
MVRSHPQSFHSQLNGVRIAGTSAAIALHAFVLMLLFTPTTWAPPKITVVEDSPAIPVDLPKPKPKMINDTTPTVVRTPKPAATKPHDKPATTQETAVDDGIGPQVASTDIGPQNNDRVEPPAGLTAELSPIVAPAPPYPAFALRAGTTGMVILRISIDIQGHPVGGSIEKSSGSRLLDQSALKFVLAHWQFNPAMQAGLPIQAVALVPIAFTLDR